MRNRKTLDDIIPKAVEGATEEREILEQKLKPALIARDSAMKSAWENPDSAIVVTDLNKLQLERERQVLERALIEEKREMSRRDFWFFITQVAYPNNWQQHYSELFHRELAMELQSLAKGEDFWAFLPRKRRKTFIITILHSMWLVIRDPNIRILIVGAREETVKPFLRVLRSAFIKGTPGFEEFQRVFPDFMLEQGLRQAYQFEVPTRTIQLPDPTVRATYLGVTGAGWRCDVLKLDDCVERRNVSSPEMSLKTMTKMMDLFPLLDDTGQYQNITGAGTRWSYHDPYGNILGETEVGESQEGAEAVERLQTRRTKVMVRHGGEDPNRLCESCPPHIVELYPHGHPSLDEDAVSCDPPIHTVEHVREDLRRYSQNPALGESLFWHQLMNVCLAPSDRKFQPEWFIHAHAPCYQAPRSRILSIDSADKDFQKEGVGDHMVALFGEFSDDGRLLLVHGLRNRSWTRDEFIRKMLVWCEATQWWPHKIVKEKFGTDTFLTDIKREFMARDRVVHCLPVSRPAASQAGGYMKKLDWIVEGLQAPMERGEVAFGSRFPKELSDRARHELINLGQVTHDDVADALVLFFVKGIRVEAPQNTMRWQGFIPPALDLYQGPNREGPVIIPGTMSPLEEALHSDRVQSSGLDLIEKHVAPLDMDIKLDI